MKQPAPMSFAWFEPITGCWPYMSWLSIACGDELVAAPAEVSAVAVRGEGASKV